MDQENIHGKLFIKIDLFFRKYSHSSMGVQEMGSKGRDMAYTVDSRVEVGSILEGK